jgi:hypothetical protein
MTAQPNDTKLVRYKDTLCAQRYALCGVGKDLYDWWDKCSCKIGAGAATKYYLEAAVGNLVCRFSHKAGNIHITSLAKTQAAVIAFVSIEAEIPEDEVRLEIGYTRAELLHHLVGIDLVNIAIAFAPRSPVASRGYNVHLGAVV